MSNTEENLDAMRGYKSGLNNPNVSDEVKGPDEVQLDQDIGRDQSCKKLDNARGGQNKDLSKVPAGPKASVLKSKESGYSYMIWLTTLIYLRAQNSPGVTKMDKKKAYEELIRMGGETPEE
ncbi:hypothetical protein N7481_001421 [Penicillium waksmanii]|uniref:uncharacterized protein n=1 Tax=Penicillium waksmanii TaxID=69791 RepID=UPI002546E51D|nr:uncharacterized protein N7481_001421 [Penicillium waksmanii]KAJ6001012.1 hypothetical protein N7481_001421 [Penicillium waksmanii]